jgi:hypothetical protein
MEVAMPGFVVHRGAIVTCSHLGPATPTVAASRVKVSQMPVVTLPIPYVVTGCAQAAALLPPCVAGQVLLGALQVKSEGMPLMLADSQSICAPNGTPLLVMMTQMQVKAR